MHGYLTPIKHEVFDNILLFHCNIFFCMTVTFRGKRKGALGTNGLGLKDQGNKVTLVIRMQLGYPFLHLGLITEVDDYDVKDPLVNGEDIPLETTKSLNDWQVPKEKVTEISTLGHGKMGRVFKAIATTEKHPDGALVSVKEFGSIENQQKEEFNLEVEMFLQLNHENVVKLIGVANLKSPYYMMIEYSELVIKINIKFL